MGSFSKVEVHMSYFRVIAVSMTALAVLTSCSVLSSEVRKDAVPPLPFRTLVADVESYKGKTVILGGYTRGVESVRDEVFIVVQQAPLNSLDEPRSKGLSEGVFVVWHRGPLREEVYEEGWPITAAGVVEGWATRKLEQCPEPCLLIKSREVYVPPRVIDDPMEGTAGSGGPDVWDSPYPSTWYR
jgi:starvation-inducible outer membrane lipoprotein